MASLWAKGPLYVELYTAIAHFIGQQQLVARAVADQGVPLDALRRGVAGWHDKTPQRGEWGEWDFLFHGGGCRLTHRRTGEPVDWNGPDLASFSPYALLQHLRWRLKDKADLPLLQQFVAQHGDQAALNLIDDLIADGIISPDHRLTPQVNIAEAG